MIALSPLLAKSTEGGTRTLTTLRPLDFESNASANSATSADDSIWATTVIGCPVRRLLAADQVRARRGAELNLSCWGYGCNSSRCQRAQSRVTLCRGMISRRVFTQVLSLSSLPSLAMPIQENRVVSESTLTLEHAERLRQQVRELTDRGLYLDAYDLIRGRLGPDIRKYRGCRQQVFAARIADCLGGDQLAEVLTYRLGGDFPEDPEVIYLRSLQKLSRRPLARMWVTIRDQELPTDDAELQSMWLVVKGLILTGMRDFDRAFDFLNRGRQLCPDDPRPLLRLASAHSARDDLAVAIEFCRQAIELKPLYTASIQTLSHYLLQNNQVDEAISLLEDAVQQTQAGGCRLQLAGIMIQRHEYESAQELIDGIERFFPLVDPLRNGRAKRDRVHSTIASVRSELAYHSGDYATAIKLCHVTNNKFHDTLGDHLKKHAGDGKRVLLKVPFVLQKHVTCAPATLTMLSAYWGIEVEHDKVVDEICYDGTAPVKQRAWAEENGMIAREFRVTEQAAHALIDAKIPFGMSSIDAGGGHINVVCGYDSRRGVFLIQDPGLWHSIESLEKEFIERYRAFGPRGLVLVPIDRKELLDRIELPDATAFDKQHEIAVALLNHDRNKAVEILESMQATAPNDWLTHWSEIELARYDANSPVRLNALEKLSAEFPDNEVLNLAVCDLLSLLDRHDTVIKRLREFVKSDEASAESRLRLLMLLESEADANERGDLLRQVLRQSPMNPGGLSQESIRLWDMMERENALELLRLAAMSGERDEDHARRYMAAASRMNRQEEVLDVLRDRFERHGDASGQPGMTYAYALEMTPQAERAGEIVREALKRRPNDAELICEAAAALGRMDQPSVGLALLDHASIPLPEDRMLYAKANLAISDGRPADALQAFETIQKLQPLSPEVVQRIAELKLDLFGMDQALAYLMELTEQFPYSRGLLSVTAEYLHRAARYQEAVEFLDRILDTCDFDAWAWRERSLVCSAAGWYEQAHDNAVRALQCERSAMSYNILAEALVGKGEIELAESNLRASVKLDCDHIPSILTWMKLCENEAQTRQALDEIFAQLTHQGSNGDGLFAYQRFAAGSLGKTELEKQLCQMREIRPDVLMTHKLLAGHYLQFQQYDQAEDVIQEVEDRFSHTADYWQQLGEIFLVQDKVPQAAAALEKALEISPHDGELAERVAEVYSSTERYSDAEQVLRRALRAAPASASLMVALARCIEDDSERSTLVGDAAMLSPSSGENWGLYLSLCQYENREADAVDAAKRLVLARPHDSNAQLRLAEMLHREDQWDESVEVLRSAIDRDPRNVDLHGLLAQRLFERQLLDEAIEACSPAHVDRYNLNQLNLFAANLLNLSERTEEACERLREALRRDPTDLESWSKLADWSEKIEKTEWYDQAATALIERAPHLAPSHGYYATTLVRQGRRDEAKQHLRQAIEIDSEYVYAVTELLRLYTEDHQVDEAQAFVDQIDGVVEKEPICLGRAIVALARQDHSQFIDGLQQIPDDVNPQLVATESLKLVDVDVHDGLAIALSKSVKRRNASPGVGYAWSRIFCTSEGMDIGLPQYLRLRKNSAFHAATNELLTTLHGISSADDPATKEFAAKAIDRILRKLGRAVFQNATAWYRVLWILVSLEKYRKARSIAARFDRIEDRDATLMIPATLAALYRHDLTLAHKMIVDAFNYQPDSLVPEMQLVATMHAVHTASNEQLAEMIRAIDKNELDGSFLRIARFISVGIQCIATGDESPLLENWQQKFVAKDDDTDTIDHRIFAELRGRIAESAGDRRLAKKLRRAKYTWPG